MLHKMVGIFGIVVEMDKVANMYHFVERMEAHNLQSENIELVVCFD